MTGNDSEGDQPGRIRQTPFRDVIDGTGESVMANTVEHASSEGITLESLSEASEDEDEMVGRLFGLAMTPEIRRPRQSRPQYQRTEAYVTEGSGRSPFNDNGEDEEEETEGTEEEASRAADLLKDEETLRVYHETHPNIEQHYLGAYEIKESDAYWLVSSYRPLWGPKNLTDDNPLTYWQSNSDGSGQYYHTIELSFFRATYLTQVSLFIDYNQDDTYTPRIIAIYAGISQQNLVEITQLTCEPKVGWVNVNMTKNNDNRPFRAFALKVEIQSTHNNGRDTHLRQMKVYAKPYKSLFPGREASSSPDTKRRRADSLIASD